MSEHQVKDPDNTVAPATEEPIHNVLETTCCIVGGGPAGVVLSLLLARQGVPVVLLEAHKDFDRDFRGDTIHPSTLEVLDQLGLADRLLQIPHGKLRSLSFVTREGTNTFVNMGFLKTRFPYVAIMPQAQLLDFLTHEARRYPSFRMILRANVQRLVDEDGVIRGVRYRDEANAWHEVRAALTVAADGRFSKVRSLAGLVPIKTAPPMDIVWLRLPRKPEDNVDEGAIYIHGGCFIVALNRGEDWQFGYAILKGSYADMRARGIEALRRSIAETVPWLADRVDQLQDWKQFTVLSVESSRLAQWYKPGLLLIGDAAHVMSPVGGVGINYAVQDAVEAANLLAKPLKQGAVEVEDLAGVQKRREWPTKVIQTFQGILQKRIAGPALQTDKPFRLPRMLRVISRLPVLRGLPARMIGFGVRKVRVENP